MKLFRGFIVICSVVSLLCSGKVICSTLQQGEEATNHDAVLFGSTLYTVNTGVTVFDVSISSAPVVRNKIYLDNGEQAKKIAVNDFHVFVMTGKAVHIYLRESQFQLKFIQRIQLPENNWKGLTVAENRLIIFGEHSPQLNMYTKNNDDLYVKSHSYSLANESSRNIRAEVIEDVLAVKYNTEFMLFSLSSRHEFEPFNNQTLLANEDLKRFQLQPQPIFDPQLNQHHFEMLEDTKLVSILEIECRSDFQPSFEVTQTTEKGELTLSGSGMFIYAPTSNFYGEDSFEVKLTHKHGETALRRVIISVTPVNDAPETRLLNLITDQDVAIHSLISALDMEGDALRFKLTKAATSGKVDLKANGHFIYSPNSNFLGDDAFEVSVMDIHNAETVTQVTVHVKQPIQKKATAETKAKKSGGAFQEGLLIILAIILNFKASHTVFTCQLGRR